MIGFSVLIVLAYGVYWKLWDTAYKAGMDFQLAEAGKVLKEEQRKNADRLNQLISERNSSRNKVIELNEIIKNPTPVSPTVIEIVKYKPADKCIFDDEFKRLLNQSWEDGFAPVTSSD
jgi:hypothetical protein